MSSLDVETIKYKALKSSKYVSMCRWHSIHMKHLHTYSTGNHMTFQFYRFIFILISKYIIFERFIMNFEK